MKPQGRSATRDGWKIEVLLDCYHTAYWRAVHVPVVGSEVYCFRCQRERTVMESPDAYKVKCQHCRYARNVGAVKDDADSKARTHIEKYQGHAVVILQGGKEVDRLDWGAQTLPIDKHGILAASRTNQAILRKLDKE